MTRGQRFALHVEQWRNGCGTSYCSRSKRVVVARGDIPADILFVGEAPGDTEEVTGVPFRGPAGKLLDDIIAATLRDPEVLDIAERYPRILTPKIAFCNILGCRPTDEKFSKVHEPSDLSATLCKARLVDLIKIIEPIGIIAVGKFSSKHLPSAADIYPIKKDGTLTLPSTFTSRTTTDHIFFHDIIHPANILREALINQNLKVKKCIVRIAEVLQAVYSTMK